MKKLGLLLVVFALLQFSCSKDDDNEGDGNGYKPDQVFQKSQLEGFWRNVARKTDISAPWDLQEITPCPLIEFKGGNILNNYDMCQVPFEKEEGSWNFDGKNVLNYTLKDGTRYQLKLVSIEERDLTAEVTVTGKDGSVENGIWLYNKTITTENEYYYIFTGGFKVKDPDNFRRISFGNDYVTGLRDNKLWVGFFDPQTREQLSGKLDKEDFNFTHTVYKGYGEYETYDIYSVYAEKAYNDDLINLIYDMRNEKGSHTSYFLWFTNSGKKISTIYTLPVIPWYDNSYLICGGTGMACLTGQGDTIYSSSTGSCYYLDEDNLYPVNHNYYVQINNWYKAIGITLGRFIDDGNSSWDENQAIRIDTEEDNFKYTVMPGNKTATTWTFQVDITEYSGKKHSHTVDVDISGIKND